MPRLPVPHTKGITQVLRGVTPEIAKLARRAHDQGYRVTRTNSGHLKVSTPEDHSPPQCAFMPGTTSDRLSPQRVKVKLRNIGVTFPKN